jgi:hypothetical protein
MPLFLLWLEQEEHHLLLLHHQIILYHNQHHHQSPLLPTKPVVNTPFLPSISTPTCIPTPTGINVSLTFLFCPTNTSLLATTFLATMHTHAEANMVHMHLLHRLLLHLSPAPLS